MENVFVLDAKDKEQMDLFPQAMADIHIDCVTHSNTIATFLPPLSRERVVAYYVSKAAEIPVDTYSMITEWETIDPRNPPPEGTVLWQGREMTGFVMLHRIPTETGPFRALVEKLLVSGRHRKKGIARRIMTRLEDEARRTESLLLVCLVTSIVAVLIRKMLDTEVGSGAQLVYPKLGYISVGFLAMFKHETNQKVWNYPKIWHLAHG